VTPNAEAKPRKTLNQLPLQLLPHPDHATHQRPSLKVHAPGLQPPVTPETDAPTVTPNAEAKPRKTLNQLPLQLLPHPDHATHQRPSLKVHAPGLHPPVTPETDAPTVTPNADPLPSKMLNQLPLQLLPHPDHATQHWPSLKVHAPGLQPPVTPETDAPTVTPSAEAKPRKTLNQLPLQLLPHPDHATQQRPFE